MISERSQRQCGDPCLVHLYVVLTNDPSSWPGCREQYGLGCIASTPNCTGEHIQPVCHPADPLPHQAPVSRAAPVSEASLAAYVQAPWQRSKH